MLVYLLEPNPGFHLADSETRFILEPKSRADTEDTHISHMSNAKYQMVNALFLKTSNLG